MMKVLEYKVTFHTPAFLGNAEQAGQWRTPPFKAQLRQWWRVAYAARCGFNVNIGAMRREEGTLFGHAWLEDDCDEKGNKVAARKSLVRIRLGNWKLGDLKTAPNIGTISIGKNSLPAVLYSGYGPIEPGPRLKSSAAIQSMAEAPFSIAFPEGKYIEDALALMSSYGTLGGRSRNGWGSYLLSGELPEVGPPLVDWEMALEHDWPRGIGQDAKGPLIWHTASYGRWEDAMHSLAQARAGMRRAVPDRLLLAYPDTRGVMQGWAKNERVPNSLRFKVRKIDDQFIGVIFHMPCRPAEALWEKLTPQKQKELPTNFAAAHGFLDNQFNRADA